MPQIEVTVVRADTNVAYDVDLPDDVPLDALLRELVKEIGLPRANTDGELVVYELSNKRTGDNVAQGTLATCGVKVGDVLLLTSSFVAG